MQGRASPTPTKHVWLRLRRAVISVLGEDVDLNVQLSPPWGRGWTATGAFISRGGTGEGVNTVLQRDRPARKSQKQVAQSYLMPSRITLRPSLMARQ